MKKFLLTLTLTLVPVMGFTQDFKCTTKVDSKKAVLFINVNASFLEAAAAQRAACTRGESFVQIPAMTKEIQEFADIYTKKSLIDDTINKECYRADSDPQKCEAMQTEYKDLDDKVYLFQNSSFSVKVDSALVSQELKALAVKDIAITSVVISGHDGGGAVSGIFGRIDKYEFQNAFTEAYKNKPKLADQLQSSLLWGCYTSTPIEIIQWKEKLPQLKVIAGFAGSGPSNIRDAGHRLMNDILVKEKSILNEASMEATKIAIEGLSGAAETYIGMYAQCNEKKEEYYSTNDHLNFRFERFAESRACVEKENEINELETDFEHFYYGSKDIPLVTGSGPLRDIYTKTRALAHCIDNDRDLNADRVGLLLFSRGAQKNFAQTFSKEIEGFQDECSKMDTLVTNTNFQGWNIRDTKSTLKAVCDHMKKFSEPDNAYVSRIEISEMDNALEGLGFYKEHDPDDKEEIKRAAAMPHTQKMKELISHYLYNVDPNCMDFDQWHEFKPGVIAKANCP